MKGSGNDGARGSEGNLMTAILRRIDRGLADLGGVARELGITQEELRERLNTLSLMGYIEVSDGHRYDPSSRACVACSLSRRCATSPPPDSGLRTYRLTEKGRHLASRSASPLDDR
ncbi:MAG TPA: hypothetical protein EYP43_04855 [Thermoplasmata archaeon]|nr:hypothetical protein [Thermoplasmata archaeon]